MTKINQSNNIRFSVVIPTFNRCDMLRQALEALCNQDDPGCLYEVVVVDHEDATDNTPEMVKAFAEKSSIPIRYLCEPRWEKHYAVNTGFKAAKGEILGLIDDDVIVDTNWVKNIVRVYDNTEVSCAGGKLTIRWVNGSPPKWIEPYKWVLGELDRGQKLIELHYPQMINAGNFSIRKEVLLKVGGYNPCNAPGDKLIGDGEGGLCSKVYHSGGRIFWIPDAQGWHIQDAKRITLSYMRRRAKFQGMSDAYTFYREVNGDSFQILKLVCKYIIHALIDMSWISMQHVKSPGAIYYRYLYEYESILGLISYLIKIKTDRRLRELVYIDDWINVRL